MKLHTPITKCNRNQNEIKISYNLKLNKYVISSCVTTFPKVITYPIVFTKEDLINKGIDSIVIDYENFVKNKKYRDYYDGFCTNISYGEYSNKLNCIFGNDINIQDIRLDVGTRCNLKCKMCLYGKLNKEEPEIENALKLLCNSIVKSNRRTSLIQSSEKNESTTYKWYFDFIRQLSKNSCQKFVLHTNGLILSRNKGLLDDLLNNTNTNLLFNLSIDSIDRTTFKTIRGVDFFNELIDLIKYLNSKSKISVIFYTPSKDNENEWDYVEDYFKNLNVWDKVIINGDKIHYNKFNERLNKLIELSPVKGYVHENKNT